MKAFLVKHAWTIVYWIILLSIVLYFAPKQKDYYLDNDIAFFKSKYLTKILIDAWVLISGSFFVFFLLKIKSLKHFLNSFLYISLFTAILLFIFQDIFLSGVLFVNRQFSKGDLQKIYTIDYPNGTQEVKDYYILYDASVKRIESDKKLKDKLYKQGLKRNDTVFLAFKQGLFGIAYQPEQLNTQ